ncbi:Transmembrane emp24 domain-containing protein 6 [Bagarius yarrelli]|uniref:Transmembrane emp24 domain-containing protein 6 n=1 Tax=Bagarius yarrelli TaxID=175774 RepID=A0A556TNH9_BAGYA|nr:Transmembrane emp24 domain-containing protein 6 [Bagarius yarrelli]
MSIKCIHVVLLLLIFKWDCGKADLQYEESDQELFWGADHYDFAIVLPASDLECFWHFAHKGEHFYLNFMVQWATGISVDRHLSVIINAPSGLIVGSVDDVTGEIAFNAEETGFYQMCFSNFHNRFGSMQIFMNFGVYYPDLGASKKDINSRELNSTLDTIDRDESVSVPAYDVHEFFQAADHYDFALLLSGTESQCYWHFARQDGRFYLTYMDISNKIRLRIQHMWRFYNVARMRRGADYFLLQSKSYYVNAWSVLQTFVIIMAGYLQLFFLKRFFRMDETQHRC